MTLEKGQGLVVRASDWSETSKIVTLWTRQWGKVRALAKGGRRLRSSFDNALDLLTLCDIVLLRKTAGALDLLTETRVQERFLQVRTQLPALYAAYYMAELLGDWTEVNDPHVPLFEETVAALGDLGKPGVRSGPRLARFELVLFGELGYGPVLNHCAACSGALVLTRLAFSASAGGVLCPACQPSQRERRELDQATWKALVELQQGPASWPHLDAAPIRAGIRQVLGDYVTYLLGKRPRLLSYLES